MAWYSGKTLFLLPNAVSLVAMAIVGSARDHACPPTRFQPPGYVFSVVWPILYLLLGVAMFRMRSQLAELAVLLTLMVALNAWWIKYGNVCEPRSALRAIMAVLCLAAAAAVFVARSDPTAAVMLVPLVCWLCFATFLSWSAT